MSELLMIYLEVIIYIRSLSRGCGYVDRLDVGCIFTQIQVSDVPKPCI